MAMFQLRLFGGFIVIDPGGVEIDIANAKERALLAYLALNQGRPLSRPHLASLLWGEQSERRARHILSQALSSLCGALDDQAAAVERGKQKVSLHEGVISVDVSDFQDSVDGGDRDALADAVALYQDGLFSDFQFSEPGFDDWALALRLDCQDRAMAAGLAYLSETAPRDDDADDMDTGVTIARQLLRLDPTSEPAHQALIRLFLDAGQHGAARKQFEACRDVLRNELGIEPNPETERLITAPRARTAAVAGASESETALSTKAEIPSIVVLPLDGPSDDNEITYIGEGLIDDITTELTRYRGLFVVSRDSTLAYRAGQGEVPAMCRRLGVRHALCGGMRRVGGKFRINLRLVDGATGQNLWSERYDLAQGDMFEFPDEVASSLVANIAAWLDDDALARARRKPVHNWAAYDHVLQGQAYHQRGWYNVRNIFRAIEHFERAIELDPGCARAYAHLSCARATPWAKNRKIEELDPCLELAYKAVELDPLEAEGHRSIGAIQLLHSNHELSEQHFATAEKLHPGHANILAHCARLHTHTGDHETAHGYLNRARQLNPLHPAWYWEHMAVASFVARDYDAALTGLSRMQSHSFYDRLYGAAASAYLGQERHAGHFLDLVRQERPSLNLSNVATFLPYSRTADQTHVIEGLKAAGLAD